ncbi:MAG: DUF523 domain-containing protein [Ruminiclostridium sp.]|nr:DUF523 domain-containing protein [Ruminiclostridium sp.]
MKILVSACLMGVGCRYDGKSNELPQLAELLARHDCIPACAEIFGGLPTPRVPAEIVGDRVVNREGADVTAQFTRGAQEVARLAQVTGCTAALLKERSPSCGRGQVYDGTFTKTLVAGDGLTAKALKELGLTVYGESDLEKLL